MKTKFLLFSARRSSPSGVSPCHRARRRRQPPRCGPDTARRRKGRQRRRLHPGLGWRHHGGPRRLQARRPPSRPVRVRVAALHDHHRQRRQVRRQADRRPAGAAQGLRGLLDPCLPVAPHRLLSAAHLRRHQALRRHGDADRRAATASPAASSASRSPSRKTACR